MYSCILHTCMTSIAHAGCMRIYNKRGTCSCGRPVFFFFAHVPEAEHARLRESIISAVLSGTSHFSTSLLILIIHWHAWYASIQENKVRARIVRNHPFAGYIVRDIFLFVCTCCTAHWIHYFLTYRFFSCCISKQGNLLISASRTYGGFTYCNQAKKTSWPIRENG